jgi:hypothetical protein
VFRNLHGIREGREYEDMFLRRRGIVARVNELFVKFVYADGGDGMFSLDVFRNRFRFLGE